MVDSQAAGKNQSIPLAEALERLPRVGLNTRTKLERLDIRQVHDLLFHLPLRYIDQTRVTSIAQLQPGQERLVEGEIEASKVYRRRRPALIVQIDDGSGRLVLRFFHFFRQLEDRFRNGVVLRCYGQVRQGPLGLEMVHPEYRVLNRQQPIPLPDRLTPVYPTTAGLNQTTLRRLIAEAFQLVERSGSLPDLLPESAPGTRAFPNLQDALHTVHSPPPGTNLEAMTTGSHPAVQRLAYEELLACHLGLGQARRRIRKHRARSWEQGIPTADRFLAQLPFRLTKAQRSALLELRQDLKRKTPMMRLLQGDVGSGKTVVAAAAAIQVASGGGQAAIMVPTELLANQHHRRFCEWLEGSQVSAILQTGKLGRAQRRANLERIRGGEPVIVIGTHALIQKEVRLPKLGLAIIDEQHRFGVYQRLNLLHKGTTDENLYPHQLIMTATPIPRTLSMTLYADLDITVIDELPPNRSPVNTAVLPSDRRQEVMDRIGNACRQGRQVYWVCSLIEDSEILQKQSAMATYRRLVECLPQLRIGLIHGRLKPAEKEKLMHDFATGEIDLLVATTVIEVGIDVANASLMVIENSERLGLSQLHQLRGRIGRGNTGGDCLLLYDRPLGPTTRARLEAMRSTADGFRIAESDLMLRGPGDVLGLRQKGMPEMRIANLIRDRALLADVRKAALRIVRTCPGNVPPLIERWRANAVEYAKA